MAHGWTSLSQALASSGVSHTQTVFAPWCQGGAALRPWVLAGLIVPLGFVGVGLLLPLLLPLYSVGLLRSTLDKPRREHFPERLEVQPPSFCL